MAYRYQSAYSEAESEEYSYSSLGHMGHSAHSSHHGFGNGWGGNQLAAGYSSYDQASSGYGLGHQSGLGYQAGLGYSNNYLGGGGAGLGSSYAMSQESSFYSGNNSCDPCMRFF